MKSTCLTLDGKLTRYKINFRLLFLLPMCMNLIPAISQQKVEIESKLIMSILENYIEKYPDCEVLFIQLAAWHPDVYQLPLSDSIHYSNQDYRYNEFLNGAPHTLDKLDSFHVYFENYLKDRKVGEEIFALGKVSSRALIGYYRAIYQSEFMGRIVLFYHPLSSLVKVQDEVVKISKFVRILEKRNILNSSFRPLWIARVDYNKNGNPFVYIEISDPTLLYFGRE
jgi:hypothetical protein